MPRLIGSLQPRPDGWWIVGMADACFVEHGPYGRREEAQEDLAGLRRIWYDNRPYWDRLAGKSRDVVDAIEPPNYNSQAEVSRPASEQL